jgi:hypothetical protein
MLHWSLCKFGLLHCLANRCILLLLFRMKAYETEYQTNRGDSPIELTSPPRYWMVTTHEESVHLETKWILLLLMIPRISASAISLNFELRDVSFIKVGGSWHLPMFWRRLHLR